MQGRSKGICRVATAAMLLLGLGACEHISDTLGDASRVDPHTVAVYQGDEDKLYGKKGKRRREEAAAQAKGGGAPATAGSPIDCRLVKPHEDIRHGAIDLDCFQFPETVSTYRRQLATGQPPTSEQYPRTAYEMAVGEDAARNRLTSILIKQSDGLCTLELGRMQSLAAATNATLSTLTSGFAAAATVVSGNLAHSILAATGGLASATRDHINVEVYHNQVATAVTGAIVTRRQEMLIGIRSHYREGRATWTIDDAIREVDDYHRQCSFYRGLDLLVKASEKPMSKQVTAPEAVLVESMQKRLKEVTAQLSVEKNATAKKDLQHEKAFLEGAISNYRADGATAAAPAGTVGASS